MGREARRTQQRPLDCPKTEPAQREHRGAIMRVGWTRIGVLVQLAEDTCPAEWHWRACEDILRVEVHWELACIQKTIQYLRLGH